MPSQKIGDLISDPQRLTKHIIKVIFTAFVLTSVAMYFLDQKVSFFFASPDVRARYWLPARELTDIGLSEHYFILSILTWIFFAWVTPRLSAFKNYSQKTDFLRRWSLNFLAALVLSGLITHIFKFTVGRQRPHKTPECNPFVFSPFTAHWHWHSFSSGHSQVMFTAATMMTVAFPKLRWFWIVFATAICITRIIVLDHFLSDTIFGACVGYVGSLLAMNLMRQKTQNGLY
ncbi:MAG: phosphatase PAP2 family protein [Bdellovibrio sp.]